VNSRIRVQTEGRNSLAMRATPDGLVVLVPDDVDADSPRVQRFIESGIAAVEAQALEAVSEALTTDELRGLVSDWSERIGVQVTRVRIRHMRRKWASCSALGTLTLATDLLELPRDLVEYVVCHDLLHLRIPDHGKGFRAMMNAYMPDWEDRERRLAAWVVRR
jgi:predicted metal-dependent hydrolase